MKYSSQIEINAPITAVIDLFDNPDNLGKWMEGLQEFTHLSGTLGEPGAKSRLVFQMGKRKIEMIETVTVRDLPNEFSGTYEAQGVFNLVKNQFTSLSGNKTLYTVETEFQFKGFMRILAFFMPGAFKKQTFKHLSDFKAFVEKEVAA